MGGRVVKLAEEYAQIEKRSNQTELRISPMLALSEVRKCIGTVSVVEKPQSPPQ